MNRWIKNAIDAATIVCLVIAAKTAIAEPYYVPSGSMEPTLQIGDELLATKYPYGYSAASLPISVTWPDTRRVLGALPRRGDIVVFRWPGVRGKIGVKRVVGLSGDRVALRDGRLWINGTPVGIESDGTGLIEEEDGAQVPAARFVETLPGNRRHAIFKRDALGMFDNMDEIVVPPDRLFVMGDNRGNSADSRVPVDAGGVGLLSVSALVGRVEGLVGSWDLAAKNQPIWQWPSGLRLSRFFATVR
ncbi:MAG TPA: signal peptidase I [Xanthobacteraceae bacterium]|jgi:signal peptidase I|nr:signal peptidase I [Xanthobacteraceae bacterium]